MNDGGGWTVFQRRMDGTVDFYRNWTSYKEGFGPLDHEHWLGNDKLFYLTNQKRYTIRIDVVNRDNSPYYAIFDFFRINNETDNYRLSQVGSYSGTADERGSSHSSAGYTLSYHLNYQFSTHERDHDAYSGNCAVSYHGAWWYNNCYYSNLNGRYDVTGSCSYDDIYMFYLPGSDCIKYAEMKIRPFSEA
ncbi:Tenascin-R [Holothuria leucospilota]|uniref:Tenascin-R n=1 Tax=Holothuria leucospilota TaxID=206669 RepID=A0A9Q0YJU3_HOLLE|nr:Tenascin-R [Holothuria leucospilota]